VIRPAPCGLHGRSCNLHDLAPRPARNRRKHLASKLARRLHEAGVEVFMWKHQEWDDEPTKLFERLQAAHVLVAEDDDDLRAMIAARLRRDGCEVIEASSGDEALEMITMVLDRRAGFEALDLVIMDVRMHGMSGLEVVEILRKASWDAPVLFVTAYPDPALRARATRLHADLLAKPFGLSCLTKAASEAIRRRFS
jgi:CheY-like chemotaxis protein